MISVESIIRPLWPLYPGWNGPIAIPRSVTMGYAGFGWMHLQHGLQVISAVEVTKDKDGIDRGPEYHLSITASGLFGVARCSAYQAAWVLHQFGLEGAEEDNHVPGGVARNFWRPVADAMVGLECACKEVEQAVVEGDYVWRP